MSASLLTFAASEVRPLIHLVLITCKEVDRNLVAPKNSHVDFIFDSGETLLDVFEVGEFGVFLTDEGCSWRRTPSPIRVYKL